MRVCLETDTGLFGDRCGFVWERFYKNDKFNKITDISKMYHTYDIFTICQHHITTTWLIVFVTFYLLGCLLLRLKLFTIPYTIKKQLKQLNENITYSVEREWNIKGSKEEWGIKSIGIRKKKTRLIADACEIEKELQDILENIQKIPAFMACPKFVIVFDELDKVSPETPNQGSVVCFQFHTVTAVGIQKTQDLRHRWKTQRK
jgi:hypothetical protein